MLNEETKKPVLRKKLLKKAVVNIAIWHAIYVRVSTEEQGKKGYSLDEQLAVCKERAYSLGASDDQIKIYIDDGKKSSAAFMERPALDNLRMDLETGLIKAVIMYDPDRMSRRSEHQGLLAEEIQKNASLHFVTGDFDTTIPDEKLFFTVRGAISEFERDKIRIRTHSGLRRKAAQGKVPRDTRLYGYTYINNSEYVINKPEAEIICKIFDLYINKMNSIQIAQFLNSQGFRTRKNYKFSSSAVLRIIANEAYCGVLHFFRWRTTKVGQVEIEIEERPRCEWITVAIPTIVSREKWETAQEIRTTNSKFSSRNTVYEYLFQHYIYCAKCSRSLTPLPSNVQRGPEYTIFYYACSTQRSRYYKSMGELCPDTPYYNSKELDESVWDIIMGIVRGDKKLDDYVKEHPPVDIATTETELANVKVQLEKLAKQADDVMKWYRADKLTMELADEQLDQIKREEVVARRVYEKLVVELNKKPVSFCVTEEEMIAAVTFEKRREIVQRLNIRVYVEGYRSNRKAPVKIWFANND